MATQVRPATGERIENPWGARTLFAQDGRWPDRVDQYLAAGVAEADVERWVQSCCVLCSNGCGMDIAVKDGRMVGVRGRAVDRVNHGRLGPKGLYGWQANASADRLKRPLIRVDGHLRETDWETAMTAIVNRSNHILRERGPLAMGFYTTGQLFTEEYYTLAVIARGGIGTPHLDGNTRLCTATAEYALEETFGCDGQPGSYTDIDACDTLFLVGHNVAETQTVLWMRMLDRLDGPNPPKLVVVDPRQTPTAKRADVHLAIRPGTNVALLNGILHELFRNRWMDEAWAREHTIGLDPLWKIVSAYPVERVAQICGVPAQQIAEASRIIGRAQRLVSTVLQGVYQSHQATAAAIQVNNINLVRGMIGKPGCTVFQMNGQPTAQNTRETGANGTLPGFRNWQNDEHIKELAAIWNVDWLQVPHWAPPTHVMQQMRLIENGTIRLWWVSCTNPAVSLPELGRIRSLLSQDRLFLVVQDAFLTETARLADVVLPAAMWGEKTGTFTNVDRTCHLSEKAINPPGEARADLDIFLDYARRMELKDKDGQPLIKWNGPESAFDAFKRMTRGRPCDYSGMTYAKLRGGSGIQWPCTEEKPEGTERLYTEPIRFFTDPDVCEDYGHDLNTGAADIPMEYKAHNPAGRAILKGAHFTEPHEPPTADRPFLYSTGRRVYHFHTRTKTARAPELQEAAPTPWVEINTKDAEQLGIADGDLVRIESARGAIEVPARLTVIRPGAVFVPFHYGYWDQPGGSGPDGHARAANELTITEWDPVSKQPLYKAAAVSLKKVTRPAGERR
jgi:anaerobic selenocysteine-containing dehydrogenase